MTHPLHVLAGNEVDIFFQPSKRFNLILDPACGGLQNIPFFIGKSKDKSRSTWFTNVDLLVTEGNVIKLVCEIDESNVKPGHIFGKFLSLISTDVCILNKKNKEYYFGNNLVFVQILSTQKLASGSKKKDQWKNIEASIRANYTTFKKFKSIKYHILTGDSNVFHDKKRFVSILNTL